MRSTCTILIDAMTNCYNSKTTNISWQLRYTIRIGVVVWTLTVSAGRGPHRGPHLRLRGRRQGGTGRGRGAAAPAGGAAQHWRLGDGRGQPPSLIYAQIPRVAHTPSMLGFI